MSTTGKVILWVVIAVIVIGGIWWWIASQSSTPATAPATGTNTTSTTQPASNPPSTASTSYPQGDSDQSIEQDMTSANAQMNGLNSDNASVTQSMNDQPVEQAQ